MRENDTKAMNPEEDIRHVPLYPGENYHGEGYTGENDYREDYDREKHPGKNNSRESCPGKNAPGGSYSGKYHIGGEHPGENHPREPHNSPVGASHIGGRKLDMDAPGAASSGRSRAKGAGRAAGEGSEAAGGERIADGRRTAGGRRTADVGRTAVGKAAGNGRTGSTRTTGGSKTRLPKRGVPVLAFILALILGVGAGIGGGFYLWGWQRPYTVDLKAVEMPEWVKQEFIRKNIFSRPDFTRPRVNQIVIHYVANPGSTAQANRDFFDSLADQDPQKGGTSTSSHFVVGLEGEVIQCIPISEVAYANAPRNYDTISIEACHPDETGKFNDATYQSVVNLTAWLCKKLKLTSRDVVRHYDISGKICPKYFVDHEDAWKQFKKDVDEAMKNVG